MSFGSKVIGRSALLLCAIVGVFWAKEVLNGRQDRARRLREDTLLSQAREMPLESGSGATGRIRFRCSIAKPGDTRGLRQFQYQLELTGISYAAMNEYRSRLGSHTALRHEVELARNSGRMDSNKEVAMTLAFYDSVKLHDGLENSAGALVVLRDSGNFEIWRTTVSTLSLVASTTSDGRAAFESTGFACPEGLQKVARATLQ
jgi:hypothetical protein